MGVKAPQHSCLQRPREPAIQSEPLACKAITTGHGAAFVFIQLIERKWFPLWKDPSWPSPKGGKKEREHKSELRIPLQEVTLPNTGHTLSLPKERAFAWSVFVPSHQGLKYIINLPLTRSLTTEMAYCMSRTHCKSQRQYHNHNQQQMNTWICPLTHICNQKPNYTARETNTMLLESTESSF